MSTQGEQGEVTGRMNDTTTTTVGLFSVFATFAKEGGRVGSGALGSGQGGVGRCAR